MHHQPSETQSDGGCPGRQIGSRVFHGGGHACNTWVMQPTVAPLRPCSCASHCSAYGRSPPCSCLIADTPAHCWRYDCVHAGHSQLVLDPELVLLILLPPLLYSSGVGMSWRRFPLQSSPDPLARDRMRAVQRNCRGGARALLAWHALGGRLRAWCRRRAARCYSAYGSNEAHAPASSTDYGPRRRKPCKRCDSSRDFWLCAVRGCYWNVFAAGCRRTVPCDNSRRNSLWGRHWLADVARPPCRGRSPCRSPPGVGHTLSRFLASACCRQLRCRCLRRNRALRLMERAAPDPIRYSASRLLYLGPHLLEHRGTRVLVDRPTSARGHFWHIRRGLEPRIGGGCDCQPRRHPGALRLGIFGYLLAEADPRQYAGCTRFPIGAYHFSYPFRVPAAW